MRRRAVAWCALLASCVLGATPACAAPAAPAAVAPAPAAAAPSAAAPSASGAPVLSSAATAVAPRPDHVVVVMLENKDEGDVLREGPYLASLAASGATLTDMHAESHPSQPNY